MLFCFYTRSHYVSQAGLDFETSLHPAAECWNYIHMCIIMEVLRVWTFFFFKLHFLKKRLYVCWRWGCKGRQHVARHMHGSQGTALGSWFVPSTQGSNSGVSTGDQMFLSAESPYWVLNVLLSQLRVGKGSGWEAWQPEFDPWHWLKVEGQNWDHRVAVWSAHMHPFMPAPPTPY